MTRRGQDVDDVAKWARLRYVKLDLFRPGAPAGDESRKLCGGEDMASKDAPGAEGAQVVLCMALDLDVVATTRLGGSIGAC